MSRSVFTSEYAVFRELLREIRINGGQTQVQLSEALGMSQSFVSKYEMGERRLDLIEVRSVCHALGTTLAEVVEVLESRLAPENGGKV
jgi:transcriptional regulator with XRE-family HTH domain